MSSSDRAQLVLCTCPDQDSAATLARALVERQLAACVSRVPGLVSTYAWQGQIEEDAEHLLLIKTTAARLEALEKAVLALHPYDVPELIALPIEAGHTPYLAWLQAAVGNPT
ncbi:divalent-cation tolerance protein CutA [Oleiagrimonas sp. C23AA]|uniref:divalent-cation tolerance protein CutA n=1 Tax=Oleiagrimonas sp. C23AA TaxID=2719047 RepID=UPI00142226D7|nr:divalent-cation tolerance protein CutA [Oleiagrimonas sp. C23AA]NII12306.1 divalent-cation tolerance protein CutA [Oleiagrimonas sp. C23AA]